MTHSPSTRGFMGMLRKLSGSDPTNAAPLSEETIRQWLVERLARQVKLSPETIDTRLKFEAYGLDSIVAVRVAGDLEKLVERRLSPALLFEHACIDDLASHLAGELGLSALSPTQRESHVTAS